MWMILHLAWSVISTVKTIIIWETRDWSWKPANFSTKPFVETRWKRADMFKSTEALQKHKKMPSFSSYTFPVETVLWKHNGILNHQVSATFPNCGNTLFHPVTHLIQLAIHLAKLCKTQWLVKTLLSIEVRWMSRAWVSNFFTCVWLN